MRPAPYPRRRSPSMTGVSGVPALIVVGHLAVDLPAIDPLLQDGGGLEYHDPARRDRYLLAGLGIAADALPLLAHDKRAEGGQLHCLASLQAIGDFLQHQFDERRRFRA